MQLKRGFAFGAVSLIALVALAPAASASYTVNYIAGTTNVTEALTGYGTTGDLMAGMDVVAYFTDGTYEATTWVALTPPAGQSVGTGWSLYESGDTFGSYWHLTNNTGRTMSRLWIDAGPGDTVFDTRALGDVNGTPGSFRGWDFTPWTGDDAGLTISANYINAVALDGFAPVGDLFRYLEIDFNGVGFANNRLLRYITDTDNILFAGDITPIPEPGTWLLLLTVGALGVVARRRGRSR